MSAKRYLRTAATEETQTGRRPPMCPLPAVTAAGVGTRKRRKKRWGFGVVWSLDGSEGREPLERKGTVSGIKEFLPFQRKGNDIDVPLQWRREGEG